MTTENDALRNDAGKGFHPLYLWGILYVLLTYAYPVLWYLTLPRPDESVNSSAAYREFAKQQNGPLGDKLPTLFLFIPVLLLLINVILAITMKKTHRRYFLNTARMIKYLLIPLYVIGGLLCVASFLLMFTPVVIMVFVGPVIMGVLAVMGWISMIGSAPMTFAYLKRSVKDGKNKEGFAILIRILQFFFVGDVLGVIICAIKERKAS